MSSTTNPQTDTKSDPKKDEKKSKGMHEILNISERELEDLLELKGKSVEAAHGFTPEQALDMAAIMILNPKTALGHIVACISTVGQVKSALEGNDALARVESDLELSTSDRDTGRSVINFSAARLIGMLFTAWFSTTSPVIKALNEKHGNVWTDRTFKDTEGGKINKEFIALFDEIKLPEFPGDEKKKKEVSEALALFYGQSKGGSSAEKKAQVARNIAKAYN